MICTILFVYVNITIHFTVLTADLSITTIITITKHQFLRNPPADTVSLNILSSDINSLKSAIARGDVLNVTIDGIAASLAAFIPSGVFSTTIASLLKGA
jgi:hypothetical protein